MRILFPSQPFDPRSVDHSFAHEYSASVDAGFQSVLLDSDSLDQCDTNGAVRRLPILEREEEVVYRGWMLRSETYAALYTTLAERGYRLINDPEQYRHAHHLPASYEGLRGSTPTTVWTDTGPVVDREVLRKLLEPFEDRPLIVKDFVKSQKHHWNEACFIRSAADLDSVVRVASRFVELQAESLVGGLVFREFIELASLTSHSKSGMPLTEEFRVFVLDGEILVAAEYWDEGDYAGVVPELGPIVEIAKRVRSRFFTIDVARRKDGGWLVMEIGDAQVSGLPERLGATRFYRALVERRSR